MTKQRQLALGALRKFRSHDRNLVMAYLKLMVSVRVTKELAGINAWEFKTKTNRACMLLQGLSDAERAALYESCAVEWK